MTTSDRPFDSIESAHAYLTALSDQIAEVIKDVRAEIATCPQQRRAEAWQTIVHTLTRLQFYIANNRRLVHDLGSLRNLLFRTSDGGAVPFPEVPAASRPFGTIESAHEYLSVLSDQITEVMKHVRGQIAACKQARRTEAWQTVLHTLTKLQFNIAQSRRLANNLRTLRNLVWRTSDPESEANEGVPVALQAAAERRSS
jgi:hypothetical protein